MKSQSVISKAPKHQAEALGRKKIVGANRAHRQKIIKFADVRVLMYRRDEG